MESHDLALDQHNLQAPFNGLTLHCIHHLFEKQALLNPQCPAVIFEGNRLSYQELNERANKLSRYLHKKIRKEQSIVAICMQRSEEMVVALLAILKSGNAYLPIDPDYPTARMFNMLEDSNVHVILTCSDVLEELVFKDKELVLIDKLDDALLYESGNNLNIHTKGNHLAYVIYTSGSTGKPKGVMIEHHSVVNVLLSIGELISVQKKDLIFALTTICFDISVLEIFMPLMFGASCEIISKSTLLDCFQLIKRIEKSKPSIIQATPTLWLMLFNAGWKGLNSLTVLCGGEALNMHLAKLFINHGMVIYNVYGPTEATIWSTFSRIDHEALKSKITIGKPFPNTNIFVLDENLKLTKENEEGEIYLSGVGLARGYLNRPELTQEKFNFIQIENKIERVYKTGDLGCYIQDGNIEFLGRNDQQIKLFGHRIELGEIESCVLENNNISESVVLVHGNEDYHKELVCFLSTKSFLDTSHIERDKHVEAWEKIWDETYIDEAQKHSNPEFNISGWVNSCGQPFSEKEMSNWLNSICSKIKSLESQSVLEIGIGTGLLLFQLYDSCKQYLGVDLSKTAIKGIQNYINEKDKFAHVKLLCASALNVPNEWFKSPNLVILNSIVQYFPNAEYLIHLLERVIPQLPDKANIFIGDVRNLELLECLGLSVELQQSNCNDIAKELRFKLKNRIRQEEELLFSPLFFYYLKTIFPEIKNVRIYLKDYDDLNELSLYRFDVVLFLDKAIDKNYLREEQDLNSHQIIDVEHKVIQLDTITEFILKNNSERIIIRNIMHKGLSKDFLKLEKLSELSESETIDFLLTEEDCEGANAFYPYQIVQYLVSIGFEAYCTPSINSNPKVFDVIAARKGSSYIKPYEEELRKILVNLEKAQENGYQNYVNSPLKSQVGKRIFQEVSDAIRSKLPEYMIPSRYIMLDQIPKTANGKIDKNELKKQLDYRMSKRKYEKPNNEIQEMVVSTWSRILDIYPIGINDNFFELGGNSLKSIQLLILIRETFELELSIRDIFSNPVVHQLSAYIETYLNLNQGKHHKGDESETTNLIPKAKTQGELSFAQERLWFLAQLDGGNLAYNVPLVFKLEGILDIPTLEHAINHLLMRHEVFRAVFKKNDAGQPRQIINDVFKLNLLIETLACDFNSNGPLEHELIKLIRKKINKPIKLESGPLLSATLFKIDTDKHILVLVLHHIIVDGWSLGIMKEEIGKFYSEYLNGSVPLLETLSIQFKDFIVWQKNTLHEKLLTKQLVYWKKQLESIPNVLGLPIDKPRPVIQTFQGRIEEFSIDRELAYQLKEIAQNNNATMFMVFLAAYNLLLARYTSSNDICVGTDFANRDRSQLHKMIGFISNVLPIRSKILENDKFDNYLKQLRETCLEAYENQELPFSLLVQELKLERNPAYSPVFQVMFVFEDVFEKKLELKNLKVNELTIDNETSKFDISLILKETVNGLKGHFEYNSDLFEDQTIRRMVGHFIILLREIAANPNGNIDDFEMLTQHEKKQICVEWNNTGTSFSNRCIHELFEDQVAKTPKLPAIRHERIELTYEELNIKSNKLAYHLRKQGAVRNSLVAIYLERSIEMIISVLAVLKAGAAYVPLEASYPKERINFMLSDSESKILITQSSLLYELDLSGRTVLTMDNLDEFTMFESEENFSLNNDAQNLAYVIYTSGSTGRPKGVMIKHNSLVNYIEHCIKNYISTGGKWVALYSSFSFDLTITSIFCPLVSGLAIDILDNTLDFIKLGAKLLNSDYAFIKLTPAHLNLFKGKVSPEKIRELKSTLIVGGENLLFEQCTIFEKKGEEQNLIVNEYGPTEATVGCCTFFVNTSNKNFISVPIGRPIQNTKILILDSRKRLVPIGVVGEIYIGGIGVSKGYWNNDTLTQEKFIADPWGSLGEKLYKTGDLAKYLSNGDILFLGRNDDQIKIRGFRVELGEIESALNQYPGVQQSVVQVQGNTSLDTVMLAYIVPDPNYTLSIPEIRNHLKKRLPDYMMPQNIVVLDEFPLTSNGKINKSALQDYGKITKTSNSLSDNLEASIEKTIVEIWSQVLGEQEIGRNDNFFDLGGHSLTLAEAHSLLQKKLQKEISLVDLFEYPTVESLGKYLTQKESTNLTNDGIYDRVEKRIKLRKCRVKL